MLIGLYGGRCFRGLIHHRLLNYGIECSLWETQCLGFLNYEWWPETTAAIKTFDPELQRTFYCGLWMCQSVRIVLQGKTSWSNIA
jgi:hypothetical protein